MKKILIETQYLPSIEFFCAISTAEEIQIEWHEHFVKQSYRNHTIINTSNGSLKLIVPLAAKRNHSIIREVKIDNDNNWKQNHWRAIESAYRKSPYFEHYSDELLSVLNKHHEQLVNLNFDLLSLCLKWLRWQKSLTTTILYQKEVTDGIDLRNVLLSKKPYNSRNLFKPQPYTQVFGNNFVENLSLLDLIFCKGPEAGNIIDASCLNH